jgi:hypothetical protein
MKRWQWLIRMIRFHAFTVGAEVGVHKGRTTFELLNACEYLTLYAVDQWKYISPNQSRAKQIGLDRADMDAAHRGFMKRVHRYPGRLKVLHGDSVEMAKHVADGSLDFVFIDADHRYEHALADIRAWTPKVQEQGIVCGHDYNHPRFPGVTKAVHECFGDNVIDAELDYVWSAKREDFLE